MSCNPVPRRAADADLDIAVDGKLDALRREIGSVARAVVAFSGGADSALVARVATDTLGADRALCVTAVSASLAPEELADCGALAREWGLRWRTVETDELDDPQYTANGADRCYRCKASLLTALTPLAEAESAVVFLGVNLDDLGDHRPGQRAAAERGARFPLVAAGLTKDDVRAVSRHLGLRTWDKPAAACLASRLPYGTPVTLATLSTVSAAESALRAMGFAQLARAALRRPGAHRAPRGRPRDRGEQAGRGRGRRTGRRVPLRDARPRRLPVGQPQPGAGGRRARCRPRGAPRADVGPRGAP